MAERSHQMTVNCNVKAANYYYVSSALVYLQCYYWLHAPNGVLHLGGITVAWHHAKHQHIFFSFVASSAFFSCCIFRFACLDFSKALDTLRHSCLLQKISYPDLPNHVYNWFVDYFSENYQIHVTDNRKASNYGLTWFSITVLGSSNDQK